MDSILKRIYLWLIPWYPVLNMYFVGKIPLAMIIFLPACLSILFKPKKDIRVDKSLIVLFVILILVETLQFSLTHIDNNVTTNNMIVQTTYLIEIIAAVNFIRLQQLMRPYIISCLIMIGGIFYQVTQFYLLNNNNVENPIVLFPTLISDTNIAFGSIRPMSFFQEPQAFATYISVFIIVMIAERHFIIAFFATLSILLSGSTEGLGLICLIWGFFILQGRASKFKKVFFIFLGILLIQLYTTSPYFHVGYDKVTNTEYDANVRLVQGFFVLSKMSFGDLLLGMGSALNDFYRAIASSIGRDLNTVVYFNSATGAFIMYGLFVGLCYWWFLLKKITLKDKNILVYSIMLCLIPFVQTCFWSSTFVYLFVMYYLMYNEYCKTNELKVNNLSK